MERIDANNYQAFILDYYEGNLTAERQAELILFLENHPGLQAEFESFDPVRLSPDDTVAFPGKASLYKGVTEANVQEYLVARLEGDLSPADAAALDAFLLNNPAYRKDEKLYARTHLEPDLSVTYPGKRELKKPVPIGSMRAVRYLYYAAAASIVFLLGVYFLSPTGPDDIASSDRRITTPAPQPAATAPVADSADAVVPARDVDRPAPAMKPQQDAGTRPAAHPVHVPAEELPGRENIAMTPQAEHRDDAGSSRPAGIQDDPSAPYVADISPDLIREKLAGEISADPAAFDGDRFEAFLDRVTDPDSSLSVDELKKPVFDPSPGEMPPAAKKQGSTPVLNALAWGMSKVSDDVKLRKQYDDQGDLIAYQFEAGKLKFGKSGSK